jgi:hypothetical protein
MKLEELKERCEQSYAIAGHTPHDYKVCRLILKLIAVAEAAKYFSFEAASQIEKGAGLLNLISEIEALEADE